MPLEHSNAAARSRGGLRDAPAWAIKAINAAREQRGLSPLACEGRPDDWAGFNDAQKIVNARRLVRMAALTKATTTLPTQKKG